MVLDSERLERMSNDKLFCRHDKENNCCPGCLATIRCVHLQGLLVWGQRLTMKCSGLSSMTVYSTCLTPRMHGYQEELTERINSGCDDQSLDMSRVLENRKRTKFWWVNLCGTSKNARWTLGTNENAYCRPARSFWLDKFTASNHLCFMPHSARNLTNK